MRARDAATDVELGPRGLPVKIVSPSLGLILAVDRPFSAYGPGWVSSVAIQ